MTVHVMSGIRRRYLQLLLFVRPCTDRWCRRRHRHTASVGTVEAKLAADPIQGGYAGLVAEANYNTSLAEFVKKAERYSCPDLLE